MKRRERAQAWNLIIQGANQAPHVTNREVLEPKLRLRSAGALWVQVCNWSRSNRALVTVSYVRLIADALISE
jgi:hypothetical protein